MGGKKLNDMTQVKTNTKEYFLTEEEKLKLENNALKFANLSMQQKELQAKHAEIMQEVVSKFGKKLSDIIGLDIEKGVVTIKEGDK